MQPECVCTSIHVHGCLYKQWRIQRGFRGFARTPSMPPVFKYPMKRKQFDLSETKFFISMGNLRKMPGARIFKCKSLYMSRVKSKRFFGVHAPDSPACDHVDTETNTNLFSFYIVLLASRQGNLFYLKPQGIVKETTLLDLLIILDHTHLLFFTCKSLELKP